MSPEATNKTDSFLLATIAIRKGSESQAIPCVVDRLTKRTQLCVEGQWLTEDAWLQTAPLP